MTTDTAETTAIDAFAHDLAGLAVTTAMADRRRKSRDYYWYSPILTAKLSHCLADIVARPANLDELRRVVSAAARHGLPVTVRGGGTGNYGQSVPLKGGVLLDMTGIDQVVSVVDGRISVQAGALIKQALDAATATGQQLMMYPSTFTMATVGGYLCGGFAGIGSVKHGIIRDSGMIESMKVLTVEQNPRLIEVSGDEVSIVFHSWGTTGIIVEATLKLVPLQNWIDCIATFPTYGDTIAFGNAAFDSGLDIFLLSAVEKRFAEFYAKTRLYFDGTRDAMFSIVNEKDVDAYFALAARFGGRREMALSEAQSVEAGVRPIQQTAFNHTTLMALQADRSWTYLQTVMPAPFSPELAEQQLARYGDEVLQHHEYTREHGRVRLGGLPLIRYSTEERLYEIMRSLEADGCTIHNPHISKLEDGGRFDPDGRKLAFRADVDPHGLLNPGKLRALSS